MNELDFEPTFFSWMFGFYSFPRTEPAGSRRRRYARKHIRRFARYGRRLSRDLNTLNPSVIAMADEVMNAPTAHQGGW